MQLVYNKTTFSEYLIRTFIHHLTKNGFPPYLKYFPFISLSIYLKKKLLIIFTLVLAVQIITINKIQPKSMHVNT
jgi:hypothetical protein